MTLMPRLRRFMQNIFLTSIIISTLRVYISIIFFSATPAPHPLPPDKSGPALSSGEAEPGSQPFMRILYIFAYRGMKNKTANKISLRLSFFAVFA
jgi:hypothetical protein